MHSIQQIRSATILKIRVYHIRKILVDMMAHLHLYMLLLYKFLIFEFVFSGRNITVTNVLRDSEIIESSNANFKLGFFSPANSTNRYLGIWYSNEEPDRLEVAWVANRENPVADSSGVFKISADGNLQVIDGQNKVFWSSNVSFSANNTVAQLLDTGNFVLQSRDGEKIWQSFEHPTDSFLPQMTFTIDENSSNKKVLFRSWKSPSDPSSGNFTVGINTLSPPQVFLWGDDHPYWRNIPWNGRIYTGRDSILSIVTDNEGKISFGYSLGNLSGLQHFVVNYDGNLVQRDWNGSIRKWEIVWKARESDCDAYGKCGSFGICNSKNSPICTCLEGFVPKNNEEWSRGNWTNGCVRRTSLDCETRGVTSDEFWKLSNLKVADGVQWFSANGEVACQEHCLQFCWCLAYSFYSSIGCMIWNESLIDVDVLHTTGLDLNVRLALSEIGKLNQQQPDKAEKRKVVLIVMTTIGVAIFALIMYYLWRRRWKCQRNVTRVTGKVMSKGVTSEVEVGDLPVFGLEELAIATNHFQDSNKLGRGGFGTVYKGKLEDEQEIAVKRLSKTSGQGLQEFMNEVLVISKLQHRNLVKLLGCCVEGEEKLLVYEYMPNKSLDAILFDPTHQKDLDWKIRFNIILGICRGLLYLHRDSRLRIIHRDLKASNILLDGNLNPKISDFGMARIMGGNEDQADTIRIVGTYGYMSPEYALEGRFSEKSDVFSFGVLLLEILSGRRNGSFKDEDTLSLLGHAWKLWNEDNILSLIDPTISDSFFQAEILRCVQLGLLCVQEFSEDRPSTSMVLSMIENEISDLPRPSQPGLTQRRVASHKEAHQNGHEQFTVNHVSISNLSGR